VSLCECLLDMDSLRASIHLSDAQCEYIVSARWHMNTKKSW
jgi:hypothetical protein